jgi:hypothetical protein
VGNDGKPLSWVFCDTHDKEKREHDQSTESGRHQFGRQVSDVCHGHLFGQESATQIPHIEHDKTEGGVEIIDHPIVVLTLMDTP